MQDIKQDESPDLTLLIPVLNEEKNVSILVDRINKSLENTTYSFEILFVDDGSTDKTFESLGRLAEEHPNLRVLRFTRNFGKAAAYSAGFAEARGNILITMDGDLQDDPEEIPVFVEKINEGFDLVSGWKYEGKGAFGRAVPSRIFNLVTSRFSGIHIHDFNCPFKAYRRSILSDLAIYGELHRFIPVLAHSRGYRVTEIKSRIFPRVHGTTKYGFERFARGFLDLLTVMMITRFSFRPLHLFGGTGLIAMMSGGLITGFLVIMHILYRLYERGWVSIVIRDSWNIHSRPLLTIGLLLFVVGFQFLSLGLLAELLNLREGSRDAPYRIRERID
ncbi:glycosyltransferase family 2 protein [Acidobacteriota bacterium]